MINILLVVTVLVVAFLWYNGFFSIKDPSLSTITKSYLIYKEFKGSCSDIKTHTTEMQELLKSKLGSLNDEFACKYFTYILIIKQFFLMI